MADSAQQFGVRCDGLAAVTFGNYVCELECAGYHFYELLRLASEPVQVSAAGGVVTARIVCQWSTTDVAIEEVVAKMPADQPWDAAALANMLFRQILADMALSCETFTGHAEEHDREIKVFLWSYRADSRTELSSPLAAEGANNDVCRCVPMRFIAAPKRWRSSG